MGLRPVFFLKVLGSVMITGDALNNIPGSSSNFIVDSTDIFTNYTDTEKVQTTEESHRNDVGGPGGNRLAGNKLGIEGISGKGQGDGQRQNAEKPKNKKG